jgi:hypothetical protein
MPLIVSLGTQLHHTRTLVCAALPLLCCTHASTSPFALCVSMQVTLTTLMMSGTMSLPMSSFPNINSLLIEDVCNCYFFFFFPLLFAFAFRFGFFTDHALVGVQDNGTPYLHSVDFIKHGTPIALVTMVMICTLGFVLVESTFAVR